MVKKRKEEIVGRILATVNVSQPCSLRDAKRDGNDMESVPSAKNSLAIHGLPPLSTQTFVAIASIRKFDRRGFQQSCGFQADLWFPSRPVVSKQTCGFQADLWFPSRAVVSKQSCGAWNLPMHPAH
jgi:hypothetical protein